MVKKLQTHCKLSYNRNFLWSTVVRGGSIGLNHSELMSILITGEVSFPVRNFLHIRGSSIGLNHPKLIANYLNFL